MVYRILLSFDQRLDIANINGMFNQCGSIVHNTASVTLNNWFQLKGFETKKLPFLRHGKPNNFTRPKSSPVARVSYGIDASTALTSLIWEYLGHIPFTSDPKTQVQLCHWMARISSTFVTWRPPETCNWSISKPLKGQKYQSVCSKFQYKSF